MWTWPGLPLQHELFARTWSSAMKRALVMVLWLLVSHALAVVLYRRGTLPGTRVQLVESEAGLTSQLSAEGWEDMGCSSTHCMVIHVLFSFSLASSSMDARLITGSLEW